jgi:hypothetical protein
VKAFLTRFFVSFAAMAKEKTRKQHHLKSQLTNKLILLENRVTSVT